MIFFYYLSCLYIIYPPQSFYRSSFHYSLILQSQPSSSQLKLFISCCLCAYYEKSLSVLQLCPAFQVHKKHIIDVWNKLYFLKLRSSLIYVSFLQFFFFNRKIIKLLVHVFFKTICQCTDALFTSLDNKINNYFKTTSSYLESCKSLLFLSP